jgi:hypothetical protein
MEKIIHIKGSESFVVGLLMMVLLIILIIPLALIFFLKFLFTSYILIQEEVKIPEKISYKLERIY